ncbi:MAG: SH3 domain-containing protein [Methylophagaceae bacterium]
MACRLYLSIYLLLLSLLMTGCAMSPSYINDGASADSEAKSANFNPVHYKLEDKFINSPPNCIAILPLQKDSTDGQLSNAIGINKLLNLTDEKLEQLRWNLYSHLAPFSYRDVELSKVNKAVLKIGNDNSKYAALGRDLKCDALLIGTVTDYRTDHFGFYSQVSIGVKMTLIKATNNELLWQGNHVAKSKDGGIPISPLDIVMGIFSATENVSDQQLVHVEDDLFRRLLSTWELTEQPSDSVNKPPIQTQLAELDSYLYYVSVNKLFLRSGPGTTFIAKDVLNQNEKLAMLDKQHSPWVQVKMADGQLGYVNRKYIASID